MTDVEKYDHAGLTVRIEYDEDYDSSMALDYSRVGTMWIRWDRYKLGDMQDEPDFTRDCPTCEGSGFLHSDGTPSLYYGNNDEQECKTCETCDGSGTIEQNPIDWIRAEHGSRVVLPLSIYEHSGITIRVGSSAHPFDSQGWDSGLAGFIFDTPDDVKNTLGADATDEQIEQALRQEVSTYDDYLTGQVYGYVIEDADGEHIDSCWGFVGDLDYVKSEANSQAEWFAKDLAEKAAKESLERADAAARDIITCESL